MRRVLAVGVLAIALLLGVSLLVVYLATGTSSRLAGTGSAPGDGSTASAPGATAPGPTQVPGGPARSAPAPAPSPSIRAHRAVLTNDSPLMREALRSIRPELAACFDEDTQARYGPKGVTVVPGSQDGAPSGTPVLVLEIEATGSGARIVDAPVEVRGSGSDGLLACAQQVLRGLDLPSTGLAAGERARLRYALGPLAAEAPAPTPRAPRVRPKPQ